MQNRLKMRVLTRRDAVFYWTSVVLLVALVLYPLFGGIVMSLVLQGTGTEGPMSWFSQDVLPAIRIVQVAGQVLLLCLPVFFLVGVHTGNKMPFSKDNLEFLGIRLRKRQPGMILAVMGVVLLQPFMYTVMELISYILLHLGAFGGNLIDSQEQLERFLMFLAGADSVSEFIVVAVVVAVIPAVCEEIFFRGYIQKNYMDALSPARGILFTGFVFGLFHLSPANLLPLTLMGWYLGYVYYKTRNLLVPVMVHFCNNLLSLAMLQVQRSNPGMPDGIEVTGATTVFGLLFVGVSLLLFSFVFRRFNRLFPAGAIRSDEW